MHHRFAVIVIAAACAAVPAVRAQTDPAPPADPAAAPAAKVYPTLDMVSPRIDFGLRAPLAFASETMSFVNSGPEPITITKAIGECSCTDATILDNVSVLKPGEHLNILFAVEFPREMGLFTKKVLVYAEGFEQPFPVAFDFEVGYPVRVNGDARKAAIVERAGAFTLESAEGRPFRVLAVHGADPVFEGFTPASDQPRPVYTVRYDWTSFHRDSLPRFMVVETDHPGAEMIAIPSYIRESMKPVENTGLRALDQNVCLGRVPNRQPTPFHMLFSGRAVSPGKTVRAISSNSALNIRITNVRKPDRGGGLHVDFEVKPSFDAKGFQPAVITIEYDGASATFDLFARVDPNASARAATP